MKPQQYSHFVFSDFSGDTGVQFAKGSSESLNFAWVITTAQDYEFNEGLVYDAKRKLSMKLTEELKYATVKRHKRKNEVLSHLAQARVRIHTMHVFKKLGAERFPSEVGNAVPVPRIVEWIQEDALPATPNIQFVTDQTKWAQADEVTKKLILGQNVLSDEQVRFAPSGQFQLLQLADIAAGYFREYFDFLDSTTPMPPCQMCRLRGVRKCQLKRRGLQYKGIGLFKKWFRLLITSHDYGLRFATGYFVLPSNQTWNYRFLDCALEDK